MAAVIVVVTMVVEGVVVIVRWKGYGGDFDGFGGVCVVTGVWWWLVIGGELWWMVMISGDYGENIRL